MVIHRDSAKQDCFEDLTLFQFILFCFSKQFYYARENNYNRQNKRLGKAGCESLMN